MKKQSLNGSVSQEVIILVLGLVIVFGVVKVFQAPQTVAHVSVPALVSKPLESGVSPPTVKRSEADQPAIFDQAKADAWLTNSLAQHGMPPMSWDTTGSRVEIVASVPEGLVVQRSLINAKIIPDDAGALMLVEGYKGPAVAIGDVLMMKIYREGVRNVKGRPLQRWVTVP